MKQEFKAIIQKVEGKNASYIEPPFNIEEVFGSKRVKVKATFDGIEYRGSIVNMGGCYMLGITKDMRDKMGKTFGDEILVTVEKDEEERIVEMPEDFNKALEGNDVALNNFNGFSFTAKKEYVRWITSAKKEETRNDRISKSIEMLSEGKKLK